MTRSPAMRVTSRGGGTSVAATGAAATLGRVTPDSALPLAGARGVDGFAGAESDAALAARAAKGDVAAFGELVERYQRPMAALVARMAACPDDVDDIVQELFIRAWKGLPRFRGDSQFSTWLYRIAVNTAIKHRARRRTEAAGAVSVEDLAGGLDSLRSERAAGLQAGARADGDPYETAVARERERQVRLAVGSLPEKQRVVVALHYFEGHSCEQIGEILGCSVGTVWSRLHYACKRLKGLLENGGGAASAG